MEGHTDLVQNISVFKACNNFLIKFFFPDGPFQKRKLLHSIFEMVCNYLNWSGNKTPVKRTWLDGILKREKKSLGLGLDV